MLLCHPQSSKLQLVRRPPARPAFALRPFAAIVGRVPSPGVRSHLSLPTFAPEIPGRFEVKTSEDDSRLRLATLTLAEAGVLRQEHWRGNGQCGSHLSPSIAAAFTDLAHQHLPKPLADWHLSFTGDACNDETGDHLAESLDGYRGDLVGTVGAIILTHNNQDIVHRVIGPAILKLEKHRPGLGQAVLCHLHGAFSLSCYALDPISGIQWCSYQYWQGEEDEKMRLEEELANNEDYMERGGKPFDREATIKDLNIFKRSDYDSAIPPQFGSRFSHTPQLSERELVRHSALRTPHSAIIKATLDIIPLLRRVRRKYGQRHLDDKRKFERVRTECTPYLLRWHCNASRTSQDPLAQVYDDTMNEFFQSGEDLVDVSGVFAWNDADTLRDAVQRFADFLDIIRAADALLTALSPKNI
jgi:PRTRC genetic system protein F